MTYLNLENLERREKEKWPNTAEGRGLQRGHSGDSHLLMRAGASTGMLTLEEVLADPVNLNYFKARRSSSTPAHQLSVAVALPSL